MKKLIILPLCVMLLSGWGHAPPESYIPYLKWSAPGHSETDIKKALLECGTSDPNWEDRDYNQAALTDMCMEHAGFHYKKEKINWCTNPNFGVLAACAPGAIIPTRSISRRLNSRYCRLELDYQYCKQNARNPPACDRTDYNNPVPECLP